jgi:hypothetical protein
MRLDSRPALPLVSHHLQNDLSVAPSGLDSEHGVMLVRGFPHASRREMFLAPEGYWYGWTATAATGALMFDLAAELFSDGRTRWFWPGWLWVAPVVAMIVCVFLTILAEVDHRTPLFRVWGEYRNKPWPTLLDYWGSPNLQVINRDVHVAKCATEVQHRRTARHLATG